MRELKATKINAADFAPFGTFFSMTEPEGYPLHGEIHKFYPDRISGTCMGSIGFSPIAVHKDERIVKAAEYHTTTWEGIVALDDDMIIHVAPASAGAPVPELTRAFIVPKGTMVKINTAIWHLCPLPLNNEVLHAMIILPECTYANDCTVVDFEEKDWPPKVHALWSEDVQIMRCQSIKTVSVYLYMQIQTGGLTVFHRNIIKLQKKQKT